MLINLPTVDGTWPLEHRPEAVGEARRIARAVLEDWQIEEDAAQPVLLVVSELVTNAVEHAEPPVALHLRWERRRRVWVGITDGGPAESDGDWTLSCEDCEHGRGLAVVDVLTTDHGSSADGDRVTHWARLSAGEAAACGNCELSGLTDGRDSACFPPAV